MQGAVTESNWAAGYDHDSHLPWLHLKAIRNMALCNEAVWQSTVLVINEQRSLRVSGALLGLYFLCTVYWSAEREQSSYIMYDMH